MSTFSPGNRYQQLLVALRGWQGNLYHDSPLQDWPLYGQIQASLAPGTAAREVTDHLLEQLLQRLERVDGRAARLIRDRFQKGLSRQILSRRYTLSLSHLDRLQRQAIEKLVMLAEEMEREQLARQPDLPRAAPEDVRTMAQLRLDLIVGRERLFGVEVPLRTLLRQLQQPDPPYLYLIEGIGGIGKTALAAAAVRQLLADGHLQMLAWVTAQQQRLRLDGHLETVPNPTVTVEAVMAALVDQLLPPDEHPVPFTLERALAPLRARLDENPGVVVVDNLETIDEVQSLLPVLRALAGPTRILLTSRFHPPTDTPYHVLHLTELGSRDALALVRYQARVAGIPELADLSPSHFEPIYAVVGGNPLALRLLVGQCRYQHLEAVLQGLADVQGEAAEQLYEYLYAQAWEHLETLERKLLLSMVLVPPAGADLEYIAVISELPESAVRAGLFHLVDLSLVEHRRNALDQSVYSIHSLTRNFLHTQILQWTESTPPTAMTG
ncbi:ATP-binding protein [Litorilinea aerophila]|uniref:Uncharacterized protein n=1 Tax=Litorilinea aerophila TaxID=1204385 RepID=A0A540VMA2_9CHLR|nr:ATP-binding protein [Litorilinea aerophila]MCC9074593.1 ATP-binding protein [Litorilinea aerophila]